MLEMQLADIGKVLNAELTGSNVTCRGISTDTRTIKKDNLFFAIQGENFDANDFVAKAKENGAAAAVVSRKIDIDLPLVIVPDTTHALGALAKYWRELFSLPIIGLTGTNGKTTLKNMLAAIFLAKHNNDIDKVLFTEGNLNNEIGMPLNLLKLNQSHDIAIIEMGMNHFDEIAYLTNIVQPDIAIINNAGPCHLEGVGNSIAGVAKAKGEIFQGLSAAGIGIINADDNFVSYWQELLVGKKVLTFGIDKHADVAAVDISLESMACFTLVYADKSIDIKLPVPGQHNIMNALAASAAAIVQGVDLAHIQKGLAAMFVAPGRLNIKQGKNGCKILDDTYNANPLSLSVALNVLSEYQGRKIVVLGDMGELGDNKEEIHLDMANMISNAGTNRLYTVGELTQLTSQQFGDHAQHFTNHADLIAALQPDVMADDAILVKGSRSMKMEQVVAALS